LRSGKGLGCEIDEGGMSWMPACYGISVSRREAVSCILLNQVRTAMERSKSLAMVDNCPSTNQTPCKGSSCGCRRSRVRNSQIIRSCTVCSRGGYLSLAQCARKLMLHVLHITNSLFLENLVRPPAQTADLMALAQKMLWCELARRIFLSLAQGFLDHGHGNECGV
jgi:hypothetical protein